MVGSSAPIHLVLSCGAAIYNEGKNKRNITLLFPSFSGNAELLKFWDLVGLQKDFGTVVRLGA